MITDFIKENWKINKAGNAEAERQAWDSVAEEYVFDGKTPENDGFLSLVMKQFELTKEMTVLDVGCGAGAYTMALAPYVKSAVGTDFSPVMIQVAERERKKYGMENISFVERDWHKCDGKEFEGQFDLVFAHTTPAIADYETFMKMMNASKRYCAVCKPARRTDLVLDELLKIAGINRKSHDESVSYTFDLIWENGYNPEIVYRKQVWKSERTLDEAVSWYLGRIKGMKKIDSQMEDSLINHLKEISQNGIVKDEINTTLVNILWEK